jgi:predicted transcriptional regulator
MAQADRALSSRSRSPSRRSELDVKMDIIRVVAEGANKPTQIMYKANLSWVGLLGHLRSLTSAGFLREVDFAKRREFETTSKGLELLQSYQSVVSAIHEVASEKSSF